jgi:hypothetical protein
VQVFVKTLNRPEKTVFFDPPGGGQKHPFFDPPPKGWKPE